jgi:DNA-3-methyladenine glycosylase II
MEILTLHCSRVADPHGTNAQLISPVSHKILKNPPAELASPSKPAALQSKITTGNILEKALAHLIAVEPKLKSVIEANPCSVFSPESLAEEIDPFSNLSSAIISQQVSGAAAKSIKAKFIKLFNETDTFPSPAEVAALDIETLRTAGLSQRKAEYIKGMAEKFASGELSTEMLMKAEYEEVFEKLIAVRGLGKWSVEMFACFGLKRMDIFSTGDLGVQ